ncbi:MAG: hypothetical protein WD578_03940 [Bacteroidales bacterium]
MKRKMIIRIIAILGISGFIAGAAIVLYMLNMPQRDVQAAKTDYSVSSTEIVTEYLQDKYAANQKYLASDGNSKILEVSGVVDKISEDFHGQKVVLLKEQGAPAGVSGTFTSDTESSLKGISVGETVTIKGVIRSGASYDEDLGLYLHVIIEKCALVE